MSSDDDVKVPHFSHKPSISSIIGRAVRPEIAAFLEREKEKTVWVEMNMSLDQARDLLALLESNIDPETVGEHGGADVFEAFRMNLQNGIARVERYLKENPIDLPDPFAKPAG